MGIEEEVIQIMGIDNLFNNIITENFPNLMENRVIQVKEAFRTPNKQDQKRNRPTHVIIKSLNMQRKILKTGNEKQKFAYKDKPIRKSSRFLNTNSKSKEGME
jgi:hypothetical protein